MRFNLETIPETGIMVPAQDNTATTHIIEKRRLDWDEAFSSIEEIKNLKAGDIVIDAGAWIGDSTETFLKKGCIVHAFEPREDSFICLLNNCPDAQCYNIALGDKKTFGTDRRGGNTGGYPLIKGQKISIPLDSFWQGKVNFYKIDVEGYEAEVLRGSRETIRKYKPIIHIEINPHALSLFGETDKSVINLLVQMGYADFQQVYNYQDIHWDIIAR